MTDECSEYSLFPQVLPAVKRIVAIGDIHGDFNYLIHLLKIGNVIDKNNKWAGGSTYVVQLGDQIDNCRPAYQTCSEREATPNDMASDVQIINYLDELHCSAVKHGGAVISLLGNHELMNMNGDFGYVSYENLKDTHGERGRAELFSHNGKIGKKLICTHPSAVIIGTNLFVHAGILPQIIETLPNLKTVLRDTISKNIDNMTEKEIINLFVSLVFYKKIHKKDVIHLDPNNTFFWDSIIEQINNMSIKQFSTTIAMNTRVITSLFHAHTKIRQQLKNSIIMLNIDTMHPIELINTIIRQWLLKKINNKYSEIIEPLNTIFWTRILGNIPNEKHKNSDILTCDKYVKPVLDFLNVNNMIIGHTPQFVANQSGINTACNGSLTRIDIGGSSAFDLFDSEYTKTGKRMKNRIPQVLVIDNDVNHRILFNESIKPNVMYGGKMCKIFKN